MMYQGTITFTVCPIARLRHRYLTLVSATPMGIIRPFTTRLGAAITLMLPPEFLEDSAVLGVNVTCRVLPRPITTATHRIVGVAVTGHVHSIAVGAVHMDVYAPTHARLLRLNREPPAQQSTCNSDRNQARNASPAAP